MNYKISFTTIAIMFCIFSFAQKTKQYNAIANKDSIPPVGIIKNLSDSELLDVVQRQTFRFFWHGAHPVSGLHWKEITQCMQNIIGIILMKHGMNLI